LNEVIFPIEIDRDALLVLAQSGGQIVEVLSEDEYARVHITGARSLPLGSLDRESVKTLDPSEPVVVYCYDYQ
jgi:rhodanese-related sulfurtransferase